MIRTQQHIKYNFNHEEMMLFEQWNAAETPDEGVVVRLNTGYVTFAGKPIFTKFHVHVLRERRIMLS